MITKAILVALDSVGIDPLGHDRPESVYAGSRLLFPATARGSVLPIPHAPIPGALVETDVSGGRESGAIECAITYTSIFSGRSALDEHGLMQGLGLNERKLESLIAQDNLFRHFDNPCLANAIFPRHVTFLGGSYAMDLVPHVDREAVEAGLRYRGEPVRLKGAHKHGLAELFTLAEINQNIFVRASRDAGVRLRNWGDIRRGEALSSSMTHELEADFNVEFFDEAPLPKRTPEKAAGVLASLAAEHDFTFYKYQVPDLVSHTGRIELAREVFQTIERFLERLLRDVDSARTIVIVTSDHGHLEQVAYSHGHPKSRCRRGTSARTQSGRRHDSRGQRGSFMPWRAPEVMRA